MSANDMQVDGNHYASEYQHWDFVHDTNMGYLQAQVVRYVTRMYKKNGEVDRQKAIHFIQKLAEARDKAAWATLDEFVQANHLDRVQEETIRSVIHGHYALAESILKNG